MFAYVLGLIGGIFQPTQTSINTKLTDYDRSPYITTLVTTATAIVLMFLIVRFSEGTFYIPVAEINKNPWWIWTGGLCGPVICILSIICLPKLGSAQTVMLTAFGQIMAALVIDNWGLFHFPLIKFTLLRFAGAVLVIIGVVTVAGRRDEEGEVSDNKSSNMIYKLLAIIVGVACSTQVAINGTLGKAAGSPMRATFISMCFAMLGALVVTLFILVFRGKAGLFTGKEPDFEFKWWMATGGVFGVIIVGSNAIAAPIIGAGMVNILNLVGEMSMGLLYDAIGFLGIEQKPVTPKKIHGVLLMIIGTVLIS